MVSLAGFVEGHSAKLVETWIQRVRAHLAPDDTTGPELRDHIPLVLAELVDALRAGASPSATKAAMAHGRQREELGFDVDALVREYGMLRQVMLDAAAEAGIAVTVQELRVLTDFLTMAMAEGVAAYARHQRRAERDAAEQREQLLAQERAARAEAETANRAKDEFLAMLGHELRNPLAPMTTALEVMSLDPDGAYPRERAILRRQVDHLRRLVDDLLDVSRLTRGAIEITRVPVALPDVVANAIEMTAPLFEKKHHHLTVEIASQDLFVEGDPIRLAQVVANLLSNAGKYTPEGGDIAVSVAASSDPTDSIVLSIRDNGLGIAPEMLPRVFELFSQERQAIDRPLGGLGLGLAIVRQLIVLHGGTVTAKSDGLRRGSEFTVRLPRLAHGNDA